MFPFFTVQKTPFGYQSYDLNQKPLIFSAEEAHCRYWSDQYLKAKQDGGWPTAARAVNSGVVEGKL